MRSRHCRRLTVEGLEGRDLPSAGQWLVEAFQRGPSADLPSGWSQWSNDTVRDFQVDPTGAGLGDTGRLVVSGTTASAARAWVSAPFAASVEASAAVYLSSAASVQLVVRGLNLGTTTPTYYGGTISRDGTVQLVKVVAGVSTVLATVKSPDYLSGRWVDLTVRADGDAIQVRVHRGDTNQYLATDGRWTRSNVSAVSVKDAGIRGSGTVGFARGAGSADTIALDSLRVGPANPPTRTTIDEERFAGGAAPGVPAGWTVYNASSTAVDYRTNADETLRVAGTSTAGGRAWLSRTVAGDVQVSSSLYIDSLVPAGLIARGANLQTTTPSYYGLTIRRGLDVQLSRAVNGVETILGSVRSADYLSGQWVQASLVSTGTQLGVQIYRSDTGQYLNANGTWSLTPAWAITKTDSALRTGERVGISRGTGYAGELVFDNFIVTAAPATLGTADAIPTEKDKATTPTPPTDTPPPPVPPAPVPPTVPPPPPQPPTTSAGLSAVARHYSWIRLANLAYYGTPIGTFETSLLKNSIDLVIPNTAYLGTINSISPTTPQFAYTNLSNIYLDVYTDWLAYADRNKLDRESAFYHVGKASPFTGLSASAVPVDQFWGVYTSTAAGFWTDVTSNARTAGTPLPLAGAGSSLAVGYPELFREIDIDLQTAPRSGWGGQYEYVKAVDSRGNPTAWGTLTTLSDTTTLLKKDGTLTFDPPKDWVSASLSGSARLYYVRVKTTAGNAASAPVVGTLHGRDYTNFRGAQLGGVTPAFDATADKDGDGYLNEREYAARRKGYDARFAYESRLFFPTYGPMRFAANVADPAFRAWAGDYLLRVAASLPKADGFFVDNSTGKIAVDPAGIVEGMENYAASYGSLLGTVNAKLRTTGKWIIANTAGAGTAAEPIAANGVSTLEEFALRPTTTNHVQFDDLAAMLRYRRQLSAGKAYEILDSLPGANATDPRVELTTLAMYYLVADPDLSFLMLNGGNSPASPWQQHWSDAVTFDVGRPTAAMKVVATGFDPTNKALAYKVYERTYQNAIVLYKPLSYTRGISGTTADSTATTYQLDGTYRPVQADGSLGAPTSKVTLRNGEGLVLATTR